MSLILKLHYQGIVQIKQKIEFEKFCLIFYSLLSIIIIRLVISCNSNTIILVFRLYHRHDLIVIVCFDVSRCCYNCCSSCLSCVMLMSLSVFLTLVLFSFNNLSSTSRIHFFFWRRITSKCYIELEKVKFYLIL